jgi:pyruvate,orthophosphate dikinase
VSKYVYFFGRGKADGNTNMKSLLGGKGANLAEMTNLGIPVPPGFTISTDVCRLYTQKGTMSRDVRDQVAKAMAKLEKTQRKMFGSTSDPLLVSIRSGSVFSMPGMMDTVLNLGLNDRSVLGLAKVSGNRRFAFDSYRRFIQMYSDVVLGVSRHLFEELLTKKKKARRVQHDTGLSAKDMEALTAEYKALLKKTTGKAFPQKPETQLWGGISAVFRSWNNDRAQLYRTKYGISDDLGTAVNVQSMVYGNLGDDCATGVAFTRNPASGENMIYGEYLQNAQGEDVVAGIRTPMSISRKAAGKKGDDSLETRFPKAYKQLLLIRKTLEKHYRDMQDVEFTIERSELFMLQTRTGKRTCLAAMNIAFDLKKARVISKEEAVQRIDPEMLDQLLAPVYDPQELEVCRRSGKVIARGLPAGPGAASGKIAFTSDRAVALAAGGGSVLLVRSETSPEDLAGMFAAQGILTSRGGITSHAAVVARGMGRPCIVGADALKLDEARGRLHIGDRTFKEGDYLSIEGTSGEVLLGSMTPHPSEIQQVMVEGTLKPHKSEIYQKFDTLLGWADKIRRLKVRANADTPHDAKVARAFGAQGIGLCRTEHMFFAEDRIKAVRQMILSEDDQGRSRALKKLLPMQRKDFIDIFKEMNGLPVTIRLLDPPLHEFLPSKTAQLRPLAREMEVSVRTLEAKVIDLHEQNPMLGHRGCRLGISFPAIYEMQVQAIFEAACACKKKGFKVFPEVMIPLIGTIAEYRMIDKRVRAVAAKVQKATGMKMPYKVGTMIEIPRACLISDQIAGEAEFFSFGTNDLTQMTFGYSRDDVAKFLPDYIEQRILPSNPFGSIDQEGVGRLVRLSVTEGRSTNAKLKIGVCGEHGGDSASVKFFHEVGTDYVSCSSYRLPVARLAAAQAVLSKSGSGSSTA